MVIKEVMTPKTIRWLHLSDFHFGKDGYGQRQLFKYILDHVRERVSNDDVPDLVFITGDIANKGQDKEYEEFYENFFMPLRECLTSDSQERIFVIPGNHDVDRNQARALQTNNILKRVPEFLDPTERGQFERQIISSRFKAFVNNDLTHMEDHWLNSSKGTFHKILELKGIKVGILGVNTAWFSFSDNDRHNLSTGKSLLEDGLFSIKDCDIKIVLGHHPIDWFLDSEVEPIRSLLGRFTALYLHGHLHKIKAHYEEGGGFPFLTLQSGASFQARENEDWVNRFLWCELDLTTRELSIEPLQWSNDHQSWVTDGTAFPNRYQQGNKWVLPLPSSITQQPIEKTVLSTKISKLEIPDGWYLVDAQYLKDRNKELSNEQAISFFDGRTPVWQEAMAPQIPRREIVGKLVNDLETARRNGELRITLLVGAAGEGKTTALLQTACDLASNDAEWKILFRYDSSALLPAEFVSSLPDSGSWLIVSDDAEIIARGVFDSVQSLKFSNTKNVQFLLCCRDTDWKAADVDHLPWNQQAIFSEKPLKGLNKADAEKVVSAWSAYGKEGLKTLDGLEHDNATAKLLLAAKSEETKSFDGSFFGAVLQVRWGAGLKNHIENLLRKLEKRNINSEKTLLDAFAYISAMHAEKLQILSKDVLAKALRVPVNQLRKKVLGPLGEEAAIATTGRFVFTRHIAIANISVEILAEKFDLDLDEYYEDMVRAASLVIQEGTFVPDMGKWNYLSSHFFDKGDQILGIRLARATLETDTNNTLLTVNLANLYRKAEQYEQCVQVFRTASRPKFKKVVRGFYTEWGTGEGRANNLAISVWLLAFSISDQVALPPPDNERVKLVFDSIAMSFLGLSEQFNNPIFLEACGAVAQLGLTLKLDDKSYGWLQNARAKASKIEDVLPQTAIERIQLGVVSAWEQRESEMPEWVSPGDKLTFTGLAKLLRI